VETIASLYSRCCTHRFPSVERDELDSLESRIGRSLPRDYRKFLLEFNGGVFRRATINLPEPLTVEWRDGLVTHTEDELDCLYGLRAPFDFAILESPSNLTLLEQGDPIDLLPMGYTACGSLLLLGLVPDIEGSILIKFPSDQNAFEIADGIESFFDLISVDEE
jgi:hypothetical protein